MTWMMSPEHIDHPYPSEAEKGELAIAAGITLRQVSVWFTTARKRVWVPMRQRLEVRVVASAKTEGGGGEQSALSVGTVCGAAVAVRLSGSSSRLVQCRCRGVGATCRMRCQAVARTAAAVAVLLCGVWGLVDFRAHVSPSR